MKLKYSRKLIQHKQKKKKENKMKVTLTTFEIGATIEVWKGNAKDGNEKVKYDRNIFNAERSNNLE